MQDAIFEAGDVINEGAGFFAEQMKISVFNKHGVLNMLHQEILLAPLREIKDFFNPDNMERAINDRARDIRNLAFKIDDNLHIKDGLYEAGDFIKDIFS